MYNTQIALLKDLEATRHSLLEVEEKSWRLRRRALWLKVGNNNSKFFHKYTNFCKSLNTIWEIKNEEGFMVRSFTDKA
jgi:hypothetical protein